MEYRFEPKGVCSQMMIVDIEENIIKSAKIIGGCAGNTTAVAKLVEGMNVDNAIEKLKGIQCGFKGTSCPDQFARGLEEIKKQIK